MTAIKDVDMSAVSITYNGVVFDGNAPHRMMPPQVSIAANAVLGGANLVRVANEYTLTVQTVVFADDEDAQATQMAALRKLLSHQQKDLFLKGLGFGGPDAVVDIDNGPKATVARLEPLGLPRAWSLTWTVKFVTTDCHDDASPGQSLLEFEDFAFRQTFQITSSGLMSRTISGKWTIPKWAGSASYKNYTADSLRANVTFVLPERFRRIEQQFSLSEDGKHVSFSVHDMELPGTAYPAGCVHAEGDYTLDTVGPTFVKAAATLQVNYELAPGISKTIAAAHFFVKAAALQAALLEQLGDPATEVRTVIPQRITLRRGLYDNDRIASFAMQWGVTGCVRALIEAAGVWTLVEDDNYATWVASMSQQNRPGGVSNIKAEPTQTYQMITPGVACQAVSAVTAGNVSQASVAQGATSSYDAVCPTYTTANSWMRYDVKVRYLRSEHAKVHRKAVPYTPGADRTYSASPTDTPVSPGIPFAATYTIPSGGDHAIEYKGQPRTRVVMSFVGVRIKYLPEVPTITHIDGKQVVSVTQEFDGPEVIGEVLDCPVYLLRAYKIYEIEGSIESLVPHNNVVVCTTEEHGKSVQLTPGS